MCALSWKLYFTVPQDNLLQSLEQILIQFMSSMENIQDELDMPPEYQDLVMNSCEVG